MKILTTIKHIAINAINTSANGLKSLKFDLDKHVKMPISKRRTSWLLISIQSCHRGGQFQVEFNIQADISDHRWLCWMNIFVALCKLPTRSRGG